MKMVDKNADVKHEILIEMKRFNNIEGKPAPDKNEFFKYCEEFFKDNPTMFMLFCNMDCVELANDCEMTLTELNESLERKNEDEMKKYFHICLKNLLFDVIMKNYY